jgi:hypothetical protein
MKRLIIHLMLCGFVAGAVAQDSLRATLKIYMLQDGRITDRTLTRSGKLYRTDEDRQSDQLRFHIEGTAAPVSLAEKLVAEIQFSVDEDMDAVKQKFDNKVFGEVAAVYNRVLPQFLPYFDLPTDVSAEFTRWMIASYWVGDYSRTLELAQMIKQDSTSTDQSVAMFYERMARLEQGSSDEMSAFINTPGSTALYPKDSAVRVYIQARLLQREGKSLEAMQTICDLLAEHSRDADWMPPAELLCAELYYELDRSDSAEAVIDDITELYPEYMKKKAAALKAKQN